ncbi:MAG: TIGR02757 family protein [Chitinivibrionales bacterium]|nr:TIGR02757 family protein [Chitinivibrionales bacterium]
MVKKLPETRLKEKLDTLYNEYHSKKYLAVDPLICVRRFTDPVRIEIAGLLCSCLAYGRVEQIIASLNRLLALIGSDLYDFVAGTSLAQKQKVFSSFKHRFNKGNDIALLLEVVKHALNNHGSLEKSAIKHSAAMGYSPADRMIGFVDYFHTLAAKLAPHAGPSFYYLLPSPASGSACKRLNMYFRWMVRPDDEIDFGIWKQFLPSKLVIPLDTHVTRAALSLGLTKRRRAEWKTALEVTEALKAVAPEDPVKYDFSLCRHGMAIYRGEKPVV